MLAPGRYPQWRSRFLRYVDTRPNGEALRKCILSGPYKPTTILVHAVEATDNSSAVDEHTAVETPANMSPENKAHFLAEKEAIHLILTGIGDDIYSTVDACQTAQEMWEAVERLQQVWDSEDSERCWLKGKAESGTDSEPVEQVQNNVGYNVFANVLQHSEQSESDDIQNDQNDVESDDKRVALANLIANLKLDTEFEKYKAFNDRTIDYDKLERKLNEALEQLAHKDTVIREGLKTKAYKLSVVKEKHDELMKQSLLTKSHHEGLVKQKMKVITDLKLREELDIEKMLLMEKQLKFLNEVVYKRSQSIQTIHMMAPKVSTYNGRPTFANPRYLVMPLFVKRTLCHNLGVSSKHS
nr:hypothetical protein [Tanacetum cinerariifolium]GEZ47740.1 hypothetical protein [Tanacetum cinerariifolium]